MVTCPPDCLACSVMDHVLVGQTASVAAVTALDLARRVHELEQQCSTLTKSVCEDRATVIRHYARIQELEKENRALDVIARLARERGELAIRGLQLIADGSDEPGTFWEGMRAAAEPAQSAPEWQQAGINLNAEQYETHPPDKGDDE